MGTPREGYRNAAGTRVPSVTTIIGRFKDSGNLTKWAYRQGREHEALRAAGKPAPHDLYEVVNAAALAGTIAHDLIERRILTGERGEGWPSSADNAAPEVKVRAKNAYEQFEKWLAQTKIEIIETEKGGVSEEFQFGGTYDALGREPDGTFVLIDWKTSNAVYSDYLVQLAAYARLVKETSGRDVKGFHLLRVAKESADFAHHQWADLDEGWEAFKHMRALYDIMYRLGKRA